MNAGGEVEFEGQVVDGADGGELKGDRMLLLMELEDIVEASEMGEDAETGFAVLAKGLDDAVVADAEGRVGLQGSHILRIGDVALTNPFRFCGFTQIRSQAPGKSR